MYSVCFTAYHQPKISTFHIYIFCQNVTAFCPNKQISQLPKRSKYDNLVILKLKDCTNIFYVEVERVAWKICKTCLPSIISFSLIALLKISKVLAHFDSDNNLSSLCSEHLKILTFWFSFSVKMLYGEKYNIFAPSENTQKVLDRIRSVILYK